MSFKRAVSMKKLPLYLCPNMSLFLCNISTIRSITLRYVPYMFALWIHNDISITLLKPLSSTLMKYEAYQENIQHFKTTFHYQCAIVE